MTKRRFYNKSRYQKKSFTNAVRRIAYTIPEKKYYIVSNWNPANAGNYATPADPTTASATKMDAAFHLFSFLNGIPQGVLGNQRIGNDIYVRYVQIGVYFEQDGDHLMNAHTMRYGVLMDNDAAQQMPTAVNVFGTGAQGTVAFDAFRNTVTLRKYRTLLDRQHKTVQTVGGATAAERATTGNAVIQHYIPVNKRFHMGNATTDMLGGNMINQQLLFYICSSVADCCTAKVIFRVCFNDA